MRWRTALAGTVALIVVLPVAACLMQPDIASIPDRDLPKRERLGRPMRITAMGTSLTARADWPDRLPEILEACGSADAVVRRVTQTGANSGWATGTLDVVAGERPDLVIVEFTINDADLLDGLSPWRSRANHRKIIDALKSLPEPPAIMLVTTSPVLGFAQQAKRPFLPFYQAQYRGLATERDVGFLNLTGRWAKVRGLTSALPDGLHPLPAIEAEVALPAIADAIARAFGLNCAAAADSP